MIPLVELLYNSALGEDWHWTTRLLSGEEHREYKDCCQMAEEQRSQLQERLEGQDLKLLECCLENREQVQDTDCMLCFARGLAIGLRLGALALEE